MNGTVGVVTRTKDRQVLLRRAIESVVNQSYPHWLQIIVNDGGDPGPVDSLLDHYRECAAGRIRVIHNERSLGMEAASNIGIQALRDSVDYLAIHDDDDAWSPEFLTVAVGELEHARAELGTIEGVITLANAVYERVEGNVVSIDHAEEFLPGVNRGLVAFDQMLDQSQFAPIQFLYRAKALEKSGLYREDLPVLGDWEFNLRFLRHFDIKVIPQILAFYHHRVEDAGGGYSNSIYGAREKHAFYRQMLKNEWLREDLASGRASLGELVASRSDVDTRARGLVETRSGAGAIPASAAPFHSFRLVSLWLGTGRSWHYVQQFFRYLSAQGLEKTLDRLKLWYRIKSSRVIR